VPRAPLILGVVAACASPAPPQDPGLDGLRAHLAAARRSPASSVDSWLMPEPAWRAHVTEAYLPHWPDYAAAFSSRRAALVEALRSSTDGPTRAQYADDPGLTAGQIHLRWALPSGSPGAIAPGLDVVFVHDGRAWRALVDLDDLITSLAERAAPGCARAYLALAPKECADWAWAIADGALRGAPPSTARACAQSMSLGCGR
jgi:hypothetical protein